MKRFSPHKSFGKSACMHWTIHIQPIICTSTCMYEIYAMINEKYHSVSIKVDSALSPSACERNYAYEMSQDSTRNVSALESSNISFYYMLHLMLHLSWMKKVRESEINSTANYAHFQQSSTHHVSKVMEFRCHIFSENEPNFNGKM